MQAVSLSALAPSLEALERALALYRQYGDGELKVMARNSLILEFEICFGQVRPALERCLVELDGMQPADVELLSYPGLIRTANERGYTEVEWERWKAFRDDRNRTAHAYSEPQAERIAAVVPEFVAAARGMLTAMRRKEGQA